MKAKTKRKNIRLKVEGAQNRLVGGVATFDARRTGAVFSNLRAARFFSNELKKIEGRYSRDQKFERHVDAASHYFFASVIAATATLESEYHRQAEDMGLDGKTIEFIDRTDAVSRFSWLLRLDGKRPMNPGARPTQKLKKLVALRNASVHYRPRWDSNPKESKGLERQFKSELNSGAITPSPFFPASSPFFPHRCSSFKFTQWAITALEDFLREFGEHSGRGIEWLD